METKKTTVNNIFNTFKILKGNAKISVICEPLWAIPFSILNFYLSLYMKELGVTDKQLGYLISLGYIFGIFFSMVSGVITDRLGRKKTTLIFDLISWPLAVFVYLISSSFTMFALATFLNSVNKIVYVSWNLMVVEDADNEQRVAAYNLLNLINVSAGVVIPLAGILVSAYGVITAERIFLALALFSMTTMIMVRNHFYRETRIGQSILDEREKSPIPLNWKNIMPFKGIKIFRKNPKVIIAAAVYTLFSIYIPLGTINSLYFAPYMTETLKLAKSSISLLGGVYSGVMLFVFIFIVPAITQLNNLRNMQYGLAIQAVSLFALIMLPAGSLHLTILCIGTYALGFGIFRPFIDTMLAGETEGNERAGIYSLINTVTCVATTLLGIFLGSIYQLNSRALYIISISILVTCIILLVVYERIKIKESRQT